MITLLVNLLVVLVVAGILWWIVSLLPLPQPVKNVALVVVLLIVLVWLLSATGILGGHGLRLAK